MIRNHIAVQLTGLNIIRFKFPIENTKVNNVSIPFKYASNTPKTIYIGITGHVRIDDNGDRDADYSILDLDPITGRFEVVAHYYGLHRYNAVL